MPLWAKVDVDMPVDPKLFGQPVATRWLWLCLITLAKQQDEMGAVRGYDCALLATRFNLPRKCAAVALTHYQAARMVELDPDGTIRLLNFAKRQGTEDTGAERASRYYENHRETIREKRKVSRAKSNGVLTAVSRETVSLDVEVEVEEEKEVEVEKSKKQKLSQGALAPIAPTGAVWLSYAAAYEKRYHEKPVRNATVNGQLAHFITRVPATEAPEIAAFYVGLNNAYYLKKGHSVGCLIADAEKLRTDWATGKSVTGTEANQIEKSQANLDGWAKHLLPEGTGT